MSRKARSKQPSPTRKMGQSGSSKPEAARPPIVSNGPKIFLYHQIWRALLRGVDSPDLKRPPLPVELVRLISRLAGLCTPDSTRVFICTKQVNVRSNGPFEAKLWFCTSPFDDYALKHVAAAQLLTTSNDQGWASDRGSWTWFEWGVFANAEEATNLAKAKCESQGWTTSHKNRGAVQEPQELLGPVVTVDDGMWEGFAEGSVLAVRVCARFPLWANHAHRAEIKFWRWFEPVIDL
ncbi:hypothetical protein BDY19DRAFT_193533 [Irpex rosettiformis]|uniref:Uncharacterized protein n=1 Tax=Irpex rosettiformis TaxID=378272 RepID=A0ACB8U281_9APHY|nr:hypothetical protein BDY19DRAFT_193533 [Irpex rosettiformis]